MADLPPQRERLQAVRELPLVRVREARALAAALDRQAVPWLGVARLEVGVQVFDDAAAAANTAAAAAEHARWVRGEGGVTGRDVFK